MSNSAKEMTECISALTALVAALHNLMDSYPDLRDQLLPATLRLSEALPCVSALLSKQTWRLYGAMASLTAAVYFIARYVH
jgi:hypothetical protein